jgi:uncharacterized protein
MERSEHMAEFTITALVKPGSTQRRMEVSADGKSFTIWTPKPPEDGHANEDVVDMLAVHFRVSKSQVTLFRGHANKKKIFKIMA